jgi:aminoglycoside phosphotransferase family enzyme
VQLGFVDFGTALLRRQDYIEEVRLNRRLAPDLYLGVRDIHGPADQARFHGPGVVIEAAVQMRQFGQGALLPLGACRTFPQAQSPSPPFLGGEFGELVSAGA